MSEKAPMPPWWVEQVPLWDPPEWAVYGGSLSKPVMICCFSEAHWSNAKELAHLIVQRTKQ